MGQTVYILGQGGLPVVLTPADLIEFQYRTWLQGALFFFLVFVGLLYSRYRQAIYRQYFLYVLAGFLYSLLKTRSYTPVGQWLDAWSVPGNQLLEAVLWAGMSAYLFFLVELLDLPRHHPSASRWLSRLSWGLLAYGIWHATVMVVYPNPVFQQLTFWAIRLVMVPLHLVLLVWMSRSVRSPLTRYVLLGNALLAGVGILAWLRAGEVILKGTKLPGSVDDLMTISFGVLLEILVFALALARRIQLLVQERDESQRAYIAQLEENRRLTTEANAELEAKVEQKRTEILDARLLLEAQREKQLRMTFEKRLAEYEMLALRSQMNPHFVFNSLNSIEYFVLKGQDKEAQRYLSRFSRLLRLILNHSKEETILLADELEALQLYLDIEASRFDGAFSHTLEVDSQIDTRSIEIPPLLLQPFAENAIWHGLMPSQQPEKRLHVRILPGPGQSIVFEVEDNGIGRRKAAELKSRSAVRRKSYGMEITRQRVELFNQHYPSQIAIQVLDLQTDTQTGTLVRMLYQPEAVHQPVYPQPISEQP
ncbi:histidine kinase [Larkinella sp. VNQ87]|uniref:histidine kinase n=1 Tax=Larkinella sp. VNQ87 TaxID=3400921 RepID=UPI003C0F7B53